MLSWGFFRALCADFRAISAPYTEPFISLPSSPRRPQNARNAPGAAYRPCRTISGLWVAILGRLW